MAGVRDQAQGAKGFLHAWEAGGRVASVAEVEEADPEADMDEGTAAGMATAKAMAASRGKGTPSEQIAFRQAQQKKAGQPVTATGISAPPDAAQNAVLLAKIQALEAENTGLRPQPLPSLFARVVEDLEKENAALKAGGGGA